MHTSSAATTAAAATAIDSVAAWLNEADLPARWAAGETVTVTFAPGDSTVYCLTFGAASAALASPREGYRLPLGDPFLGLLAGTGGAGEAGRLIPVTYDGDPYPSYVAEKIGTDNAFTVAAVGVVWQAMLGRDADHIARIYAEPDQRIRVAEAIASWRLA